VLACQILKAPDQTIFLIFPDSVMPLVSREVSVGEVVLVVMGGGGEDLNLDFRKSPAGLLMVRVRVSVRAKKARIFNFKFEIFNEFLFFKFSIIKFPQNKIDDMPKAMRPERDLVNSNAEK